MATEVSVKHDEVIRFEKAKRIAKNGTKCTTTAALSIVDGHAYVLKYNDEMTISPAILYYVKNIAGSRTVQDPIQLCKKISGKNEYVIFNHPNSLTHYNGRFYMIDLRRGIYRFSISGEVDQEYTLDTSMTDSGFSTTDFNSIAHYDGSLFILNGKVNKVKKRRKYWVVQLNNGTIKKKGYFFCSGCAEEAWEGNDIFYDAGTHLFYVTLVHKISNPSKKDENIVVENKIFTYDLSKLNPESDCDVEYQPTRILDEPIDEQIAESYEYEGLSIWNKRKYVAVEQTLRTHKDGFEDDGIEILSAIKS